MRLSAPVLVALTVVSASCTNLLDAPSGSAGFVTMEAREAGTGSFVVTPLAVFYGQTNLRFNPGQPGTCAIQPYTDDDPPFNSGNTLDVGSRIITNLPARQDTLLLVNEFGFRLYRSPNAGGIPLVPGDTFSLTVPGGTGFPAAAMSARTAEAFTFDSVGVPAVNQPLPITWSAAPVSGSTIVFSLRYGNDRSAGVVNEQLACWFNDTGSGVIDPGWLDGWIRAMGGLREVSATRLRSREVQIDANTRLAIISTFSVPTPSLFQ